MTGDDLNAIDTGLHQPVCGIGVALNDLVDHRLRHGLGHDMKTFVWHCRCGPSDLGGSIVRAEHLATWMKQLTKGHGTLGVYGIDQALIAGNTAVMVRLQDVGGIERRFVH